MFCPQNGEHVGPEMGPRAAGISQLCHLPPRVGMQTLQDRRKSCRLARPWMSKNHEVRGKAYTEPQVRGSNGVKRGCSLTHLVHVCARVCCALKRKHTSRDTAVPESAAPQTPKTSVRVRLGFKRPQMQPSTAAPMLHYANLWCLRSVKIMLPFSPNWPFADSVDQSPWSASYVSYSQTKSCLADHQNPNKSSNEQQAQTTGTPKTLLGNNKMLKNSLNIFYYFNCKIYCVDNFQ